MTTNHPEKLDEALIRPGRVDHQVAFTNATRHQIAQLFERMYTNDLPTRTIPLSALNQQQQGQTSKTTPVSQNPASDITSKGEKGGEKAALKEKGEEEELTKEELQVVARQFADEIPENVFSPAEIQGFLLKRKKEPRKAVREVGEWVGGMVERKMGGGGGF